jgi:hypothetical protein
VDKRQRAREEAVAHRAQDENCLVCVWFAAAKERFVSLQGAVTIATFHGRLEACELQIELEKSEAEAQWRFARQRQRQRHETCDWMDFDERWAMYREIHGKQN